jgi:hypothetical protein
MLTSEFVERDQVRDLMSRFVGLPLTRCRRGYGSAILLDFGTLHTIDTPRPSECGDCHVLIEWSWRVEGPRAIKFGSWSTDARMNRGLKSLEGLRLVSADVEGRLPELVLELENKTWVHSFQTTDGQPDWAFFLAPEGDWIHVARGRLERQTWSE